MNFKGLDKMAQATGGFSHSDWRNKFIGKQGKGGVIFVACTYRVILWDKALRLYIGVNQTTQASLLLYSRNSLSRYQIFQDALEDWKL